MNVLGLSESTPNRQPLIERDVDSSSTVNGPPARRRRYRSGLGTVIALAIGVLLTIATAVRFWQHQTALQRDGFATSENGLLWKAIHVATYPGALPAYVVGSTTGSRWAAGIVFLVGMLVSYGMVGVGVDLLCRLLRQRSRGRTTPT